MIDTKMTQQALLISLLAVATIGCGLAMSVAGYPPEARRKTPPSGIAGALAVGALAPDFELAASTGGKVALNSVLADRAALVVFYRGDW